jgi:hypothetical protein
VTTFAVLLCCLQFMDLLGTSQRQCYVRSSAAGAPVTKTGSSSPRDIFRMSLLRKAINASSCTVPLSRNQKAFLQPLTAHKALRLLAAPSNAEVPPERELMMAGSKFLQPRQATSESQHMPQPILGSWLLRLIGKEVLVRSTPPSFLFMAACMIFELPFCDSKIKDSVFTSYRGKSNDML